MSLEITRETYASLYGPTVGDRIRLADTDLFALVEKDYTEYGQEILVGEGRNVRDGMLACSRVRRDSAMDVVISNVVVIDPVLGIFKGNIGIKDGIIYGIGSAGNPDIKDNVDLVLDTLTGIVPAEGLIATPGGVDCHVHLTSPRLLWAALASGITTVFGMGCGGVWDVGTNPACHIERMLEAFESIPVNVGFIGRGSSSHPGPLLHILEAGACALKIHEDVGGYSAVIDNCLRVAEEMDVPVLLHTDTANESGDLEDTLNAIGGRTVVAYHVEGTGGGHIPDIITIVGRDRIISSSTNPTLPDTIHTSAEHLDMIMVVHRLNPSLPEDVLLARGRIRAHSSAAEDILHDMGAISIIGSDGQGMGRIGETVCRTWQLAHKMKRWARVKTEHDNERILRYIAKYTINPAIAMGVSRYVGSLEPGKVADIVLWRPALFGVKPEVVFKSGFACLAALGDGNGSTRICEPLVYYPQFGGTGLAGAPLSLAFVSGASVKNIRARLPHLHRRLVPVMDTRGLGPEDMVHNSARPRVEVDPDTGTVYIDGKMATCEPVSNVPLNRIFFLG